MTETMLRLALVTGSVREGRFGPTVTNWFAGEARAFGRYEVDTIDLRELPLPLIMPGWGEETPAEVALHVRELSGRLAAADAIVVVTPEYNHSFPASLKNAIDWTREEWFGKPVGLISYGGQSGGIRAAEQLRQVFPEMHAMTVRDALSFHNARDAFGEDGRPKDEEAAARAAKGLLDQLDWWAEALRTARARRPYTA
ncbi:NAD(P)H-dependent oxidoreductase [Streptomyces calidiresistens]|uniref:NADPH-dependent FMN reductase n=1 Tax=Streptomyces calidiresistens TaxID=1485586 RepID=A0A7W3XWU0_9ACTN|nr:NAD(P)H-dependent oxidoreductase [Streptomyces calidiresistens]MBB0230121.1 NADPH-dependent FMN reductase [Streptomyces calidiresistens]